MEIVKGNLLELVVQGKFDVIVHGCNCMCAMGAGIAKLIKEKFPEAYEADLETVRGDKAKLGSCSYATVSVGSNRFDIVNAYTQYDWKGDGVLVNYDALRSCMKWIKEHYRGKRIGIPKIGAGLAGGDWKTINKIIVEELFDEDLILVIKE